MFLLKKKADEEIVQHVLAGRRDAFGVLVERYLPVVYGLALARTGNRADADDTTQEAFLKAYTSLDQLRDAQKFGPWLITIAKNIAGQLGRMTRREAAFASRLAVDGIVAPPSLEREELQQLLWDEIQELDEASRDILVLHYRAGKSSREIAALLEISDEAVRKRLQRAREALSVRLLPTLGKEKEAKQAYRERANRIMGIVLTMPTPWLATALPTVGVLTFGAKLAAAALTAGMAVTLAAGITGWMLVGRAPTPAELQSLHVRSVAQASNRLDSQAAAPVFEEALGRLLKRVRSANDGTGSPAPSDESSLTTNGAAVPMAKPESGPGALDGIVVYPDGRAAPGTQVHLIRGDKYRATSGRAYPLYEDAPPNGIWKSTETDSKGRFNFANLPLIDYTLIAQTAGGLLLRSISSTNLASQTRIDRIVCLELQPAKPLSGMVLDSEGRPVEGATVYPYYHGRDRGSEFPLYPGWQQALAVLSDQSGRFRFESLYFPRWKLLVTAAGYASAVTDFVPVDGDPVSVVLRKGGAVSGKAVLAETGRPLPDVRVKITPANWLFDEHVAVTDADGRFSATGLQMGEWLAEIEHPILTLAQGAVRFSIAGDETKAELRLESIIGATASGRVYRNGEGESTEGLQVVAWSEPDETGLSRPRYSLLTDQSGAFSLGGLRPGTYTLELCQDGVDRAFAKTPPPLVVTEGAHAIPGLELRLPATPPEARMRGLVQDTQGRPVACAVVSADVDGQLVAVGFTDSRGRFDLAGLPEGDDVYVCARKGEYLASRRVVAPPGQRDDVPLLLETAASVEGRLVDREGLPLLTGNKKGLVTAVPVTPSDAPSSSVLTGLQGWYRLVGLTAGTYDIYVEAQFPRDEYPPRTRIAQVELTPGQELVGVDLVYGLAATEFTIAGRVTASDGSPISDALVTSVGPVRREAATIDDGTYVLRGLQIGTYAVTARSSTGGVGHIESVEAGVEGADIVLAGLGELEGRVVDRATRKPLADYVVSVSETPYVLPSTSSTPGATSRIHHESGQFRLSHVPAGTVALTVRAPGYAPAVVNVPEVQPGNRKSGVTIAMERGGEIRGKATVDGRPLSGQVVWVQGESIALSARTDHRGRYSVRNVPAGDAYVNLSVRGEKGTSRSITCPVRVSAGAVCHTDLALAPADGALAGVVTLDQQAPSRAYLHVRVNMPGGEMEQLYTDVNPDGTYYLEGVPVGVATVQAFAVSRDGVNRIDNATVSTISGAVIRQDFDFSAGFVVAGRVLGIRADEFAVLLACEGEWPTSRFHSMAAIRDIQAFQVGHVTCAPDGTYAVTMNKPGTYTIAALALPRLGSSENEETRSASTVVTVAPEAETHVDLSLP